MTMVNQLLPEWRDTQTQPSENFYKYANGSWLIEHKIPEDYPMWGAFTEIQDSNESTLRTLLESGTKSTTHAEQIAQRYFTSGMNVEHIEKEGIAPVAIYIDMIQNIRVAKDVMHAIATLQAIGIAVPFSIEVSPDFDDSSLHILYVSQAGIGLPERSYYLRQDEQAKQLQNAYKAHIAKQLVNARVVSVKNVESAANAIYEVECSLAKTSLPAEKLRDVQITLNKVSYKDFEKANSYFDIAAIWHYLQIKPDTISVSSMAFIKKANMIFGSIDIEVLKLYLLWHIIRSYASALSSKFESTAFDFYGKILSGQAIQKPRWKRMLQHATNDVGDAVAQMFVDATFTEQSKKRCEYMVKNLLTAMRSSINNLDWMSEPTKKAALHKLSKFNYKIGYPSKWHDYSGLDIDAKNAFATNKILAIQHEVKYQIAKLGNAVDQTEWSMPAHVVNAYYHPLLNEIVFPAGILQPPMFFADADDATMYGSIGAVIGHEITHGFDDQGSQFDADGKLHNWWTAQDRAEFELRTKKLIDQYSEYIVLNDKRINGLLTLGENIADLGGLTIAYEALRLSKQGVPLTLQESKQFFLAYATIWRMNYKPEIAELLLTIDTHSPSEYRANGPLSNFEPFFEAYSVATGSAMRRKTQDIVKIW